MSIRVLLGSVVCLAVLAVASLGSAQTENDLAHVDSGDAEQGQDLPASGEPSFGDLSARSSSAGDGGAGGSAQDSEDVALPREETDKRDARSSKTEIFQNEMYRFCRDPEYRLHPDDRYLCDLADEARAACPEFAGACARPVRRADGSWDAGLRSRKNTLPELESLGIDPSRLHVMIQRFVWPLLGLFLLILVGAILRNIVRLVRATKPSRAGEHGPSGTRPEPLPRIEVETNAERLLERASAASRSGDYERAMTDAYWALLRFLDQRGRFRVQASRTNGDYIRELARHPEEQARVRGAAQALERVQFGRARADSNSFQDVWNQVQAIVKKGVLLGLLVAAGFAPSACAEKQSDAFERAWSGAPGGLLALMQLLHDRGVDTRWRAHGIDELKGDVSAVIVLDATLEPAEWDNLFDWVKLGGSLLVAGGPNPVESLVGVRRAAERCDGHLTLHPDYQGPDLFEQAVVRVPSTEVFEWTEQAALPVLECGTHPYLVMTGLGEGSLAALPSPELLTNAALAAADNAYVMLGLLSQPGTTVEFVGTWTGSGADSPFESAAHANLEPWLVQLLLLFLVFYLWQGMPFAKLRESSTRQRRSFVEHVRALSTQYRRARASRYALSVYTPWAIERLRERTQLGRTGGLLALGHAVAARTGRPEATVVRVLVDATHAHEDPEARAAHHLETMKFLTELVAEIGGRR